MVNVKSKGNRYQQVVEEMFQRFVDEYNRRYPNQRMWIKRTHGKDTPERPADFVLMQEVFGEEYPWLHVECKHVKKATQSMKRKWWDDLFESPAIIVYREHGRRGDWVIFDKYLGERPLKEWFRMMLEGK